MSASLLLKGYADLFPLTAPAPNSSHKGFAIRLQKTSNIIGSGLLNLAIKSTKNTDRKTTSAWIKTFGLLLVVCLHVALFSTLVESQSLDLEVKKSAVPMMVSLVTPPMQEVAATPEIVPIVAPVKAARKNKIKLKKLVKKITPVEKASQPLVEATVAPVIEEFKLEKDDITAQTVAAIVEEEAEVVVVEEKIEPPKFGVSYLNNPAPKYPRFSRRAGEEGRVLLKVLVTADGAASTVGLEMSSGFERLDKAAIKAVKRWRFVPARKGREALSAYVLVPVKFTLSS